MRITGGIFKGRKISSVSAKIDGFRPTTDFLRASIFSSLCSISDFRDFKVLDLFAGTGVLGIEALSRGAESVTFLESNAKCCAVIKQNLQALNIANSQNLVIKEKFENVILDHNKFDLVLADPPYGSFVFQVFLDILLSKNVLLETSRVVFEDRALTIKMIAEKHKDEDIYGYKILKVKTHGEAGYVIFGSKD